jgi:hypothetical protein
MKMEEKKEKPEGFSTCLEGFPFAEAMQKMAGRQGVGSLCDQMMRTMMKRCCAANETPKEEKKEESHDRDKS